MLERVLLAAHKQTHTRERWDPELRSDLAQALAMARQQLAQANAAAMPEACLRILENEVQQQETAMKQAQPLGQKNEPTSASPISSRCRIW